jgi:DNA-binding NtrC family response regulator
MVDEVREATMYNDNKILVVDDEADILDLFAQAFYTAGYEVMTAGSAEDALGVLSETNIQVMFIDLNLPYNLRSPLLHLLC